MALFWPTRLHLSPVKHPLRAWRNGVSRVVTSGGAQQAPGLPPQTPGETQPGWELEPSCDGF